MLICEPHRYARGKPVSAFYSSLPWLQSSTFTPEFDQLLLIPHSPYTRYSNSIYSDTSLPCHWHKARFPQPIQQLQLDNAIIRSWPDLCFFFRLPRFFVYFVSWTLPRQPSPNVTIITATLQWERSWACGGIKRTYYYMYVLPSNGRCRNHRQNTFPG